MFLVATPAFSWELSGSKALIAHTRDQQHIRLGNVNFTPAADGKTAFSIAMDPARFTDHFLSMKEFKCLDGAGEVVCHVPYPYRQPGTVSAGNYTWLEHSLLFLFKQPTDFGAKLWNGLIFRFERTDAGLVGHPQSVDLNEISAPPDVPNVPPYGPAQRSEVAAGARWLESITIE